MGGRPAFRINLTSVLFASAAEGGKSSGAEGANALQGIKVNPTDNWKLTIKDTNRTFTVTDTSQKTLKAGETLTLDYTGAKTGSNEYVSAMLLDHSGKPAYYGRMKQVSAAADASGALPVTLPAGLTPGEYTLQVMSEQYNGDKETDVASVPAAVPVKVERAAETPAVTESVIENVPASVKQGEKVTFTVTGAGMDNVSPVRGDERWKPVSWSVNPSGTWTGAPYTAEIDTARIQNTGQQTLTITFGKQQYNGTAWADMGETRQQSVSFLLEGDAPATPPSGDPATPGDVATPTDEKGGDNPTTGDPISIGWLAAAATVAISVGAAADKRRRQS